jgi:hypothetical protein
LYFPSQGQYDLIKSSLTIKNFSNQEYRENELNSYLNFIINDDSYQIAFDNLKNKNFKYSFDLEIKDLVNLPLIDCVGDGISKKSNDCRILEIGDREIKGEYYRKNNRLKYYTAKFMESLLCAREKQCSNQSLVKEPRVDELMEILMSPGQIADLQFIGYKTDLFSDEMSQYYNYRLSQIEYKKSECIVFEMDLKPEYRERKKKKTIIKSLKSYYNKTTNRAIAKEMVISYKTPLQNYDINFSVDFDFINGKYLPKKIEYQGIWVVIPHRTEIGKFTIEFNNPYP